jgi:hypothetical protein
MDQITTTVIQEIVSGQGVPLSEVAELCPSPRSQSGHRHTTTLLRWVRNGVKLSDGTVTRLEAARVGTRWLTSRAAIVRFITALTPTEKPTPTPITLHAAVDQNRVRAATAKLMQHRV